MSGLSDGYSAVSSERRARAILERSCYSSYVTPVRAPSHVARLVGQQVRPLYRRVDTALEEQLHDIPPPMRASDQQWAEAALRSVRILLPRESLARFLGVQRCEELPGRRGEERVGRRGGVVRQMSGEE